MLFSEMLMFSGMMDKRVMLLCIVLLSVSWLCEARQIGEQIVRKNTICLSE